jgi:type IV fimbrial biogenesis protein FimT
MVMSRLKMAILDPTNFNQKGFSMAELMIAIAIVGILATSALPAFREFMQSQKVRATASDLHLALLRTRSESIKRSTDIALSPVSGDWANGWTIPNPAVQGKFLEEHGATKVSVSGPASVTYNRTGRISGNNAVSFTITADDTTAKRCVQVTLSGLPVVKKTGC